MKALVVGGTGFIGSHIVRDLLSRGIEVRVLVRKKNALGRLPDQGIEFKYGNILDGHSIKEHTKDVDLVFSAFGVLGQWGIPDRTYREINTGGVKNLIESCLDSGVKQFIHISSAGVLGPLPDGVVADESFPCNPSNIYERTKCEAEDVIIKTAEKHGISYTIIRPEFVYGPGDTHVLGLFKAILSRRFVILGNGRTTLHPTFIDDLIQGVRLCTDNPKALGKIFLITGERPVTVQEMAEIIAEELNVRLPGIKVPLGIANAMAWVLELGGRLTHFEPLLTRSRVKFFTENRAFSSQKAREELGFVPRIGLREGVRRTIRWYREKAYL